MITLTKEQAKFIIQELKKDLKEKSKDEFNSHEFIEKYAYHYEEEYIDLLYDHKKNHAFQTVHRQIGHFLSKNMEALSIEKTMRKENLNIFGHETEVQFWKIKSIE